MNESMRMSVKEMSAPQKENKKWSGGGHLRVTLAASSGRE
jgi:hypothetical protein